MRRKVLKTDLIAFIKRLDTRCKKYDDAKFDEVIDKAFGEMPDIFTDEDALEVTGYIDDGVKKMSYDIERDVSYIYDAFLSEDSRNAVTNSDLMVEVDPRVKGRVNIDFSSQVDMYGHYSNHPGFNGTTPKILIAKYYYTPTSTFDEIYMDRDAQVVLYTALKVAAYSDLHDVKKHAVFASQLADKINLLNPDPLDFSGAISGRRFAI